MFKHRVRFLSFILALVPLVLAAAPENYRVEVIRSNMVPMRDGTLLSTDLYIPQDAGERLPVILVRTVYGKNSVYDDDAALQALAQNAYSAMDMEEA